MNLRILSIFCLLCFSSIYYSNIIFAQFKTDTTFNPFDEALKHPYYSYPRDTGVELGISFINIGYLSTLGDLDNDISNGISMKPSINIYHRRIYLMAEVIFSDLNQTKTDLSINYLKKGLNVYQELSTIALGYNITRNNTLHIVPYLGYVWHRIKLEDNNDNTFTVFYDNSLSYGLSIILRTEYNNPIIFLNELFKNDNFIEIYLNLSITPYNYNKYKFKGSYLNFNLGFYLNDRISINRH